MSNEYLDSTLDVREAPPEGQSLGGAAELARVGQEKPADQVDREQKQAELRKLRSTASSEILVDLSIDDGGQARLKVIDQGPIGADLGKRADPSANAPDAKLPQDLEGFLNFVKGNEPQPLLDMRPDGKGADLRQDTKSQDDVGERLEQVANIVVETVLTPVRIIESVVKSLVPGGAPEGDQPGGQKQAGDQPGGQKQGGDQPGGQKQGGDQPGGQKQGGDQPGGQKQAGDQPGGQKQAGDQPGDKKQGGDQPGGQNQGGDQPGDKKQEGDRSGKDGEKEAEDKDTDNDKKKEKEDPDDSDDPDDDSDDPDDNKEKDKKKDDKKKKAPHDGLELEHTPSDRSLRRANEESPIEQGAVKRASDAAGVAAKQTFDAVPIEGKGPAKQVFEGTGLIAEVKQTNAFGLGSEAALNEVAVSDARPAGVKGDKAGDSASTRAPGGDATVGDAGPATGKVQRLEAVKIVGEYRGEVINRDVEPSTAIVTKETIADIARHHLGDSPPPTEEEVQKHIKEIARINNIKNPDKVPDGTKLELPGHTKDGGFVTRDDAGTTRTVFRDGVVRYGNPDGSGYEFKPGENGSYTEHHFGPKSENNYELRKTADGRYEFADAGKENFKEVPADAKDPRVERAKLRDLADAMITDPKDRAKFESEMNRFESRSTELTQRYEKQGMTPDEASKKAQKEITKTVEQIRKLMETPDNPNAPIKQADRVILAEQIMHQAADPTDVSQGGFNTCNVATVESRAYASSPSEAARLVTDIATTGKYTSDGKPPVTLEVGKDKDINPDSLVPHGESGKPHEPGSNHRSFASQVFEVTAVNLHYAKENAKAAEERKAGLEAQKGKTPEDAKKIDDEYFQKWNRHLSDPPQQIKYEQQKPGPDQGPLPDNGERLLDYSKVNPKTGKAPAELERTPGLKPSDIGDIAKEIGPATKDGAVDGALVLANGVPELQGLDVKNQHLATRLHIQGIGDGEPLKLDDPRAVEQTRQAIDRSRDLTPQQKEEFKRELAELERERAYHLTPDGVGFVADEKQLNLALQRLSEHGALPVVVAVHTGKEPFRTISGTTGLGGEHVVTVTQYDAGPPAQVKIDNQWDQSNDKWIPVDQLYGAMKGYDHLTRSRELKAEVDKQREKGEPDLQKEAELLQELKLLGGVKNSDVSNEIVRIYQEGLKQGQEGKLNQKQLEELTNALEAVAKTLPPDEQQRLSKRLQAIIKPSRPKALAA